MGALLVRYNPKFDIAVDKQKGEIEIKDEECYVKIGFINELPMWFDYKDNDTDYSCSCSLFFIFICIIF